MSEPTSSAAAAAADAAAADAAAVAAAVADSDNLRRSKRKKFCLDVVAAAHGNNQKKSRRDPHGDEEYDEDDYEDVGELEELSVVTDSADLTLDDDLDESMMRRRPKRAATSVVTNNGYQDHVVFEMQGEHVCQKCPSRYTSRSSLANHVKMHQGERRKFACELCDFSSTTIKSLTHHMNVHKVHGVVSAPVSPADPSARSNDVANVTAPPDLLNISTESNTSLNGNGGAAPQLTDATLEPFQDAANDVDDEEDEMMMPPILEREDDGPPVLLRERRLIEDSTEESEEESESESSTSPEPVRKSGRSTKPTQKKAMAQKKPPTPYKKASLLKPLRLDTPLSSGSLPTSSASSVTPPEKRSPSPTSTESSRETTPAAAKNVKIKNKHCAKCPFVTSTLSRLKRHFTGHQVKEGYICPIENCHFICRKAGFLSKHFILHVGLTLPWPPKYVKKIGKKIIEVPELNEHLGEKERKTKKKELENRVKEEPDDLLEDEDEEEEEEEEEMLLRKEDPVEVKEEEPMEQEPMDLEHYEPMEPLEPLEPLEPEPMEPEMKSTATTKKEKKKVYKKKKAELKKEKAVEEKKHLHHEKKDSMGQAQIRSYKKVVVDGVEQKQCNVGNCEFQTVSLTQLVVHKVKEHAAQSAFPSHRFLCFTCGFRAKTYAALRTHKLTNHTHTKCRFHRTYYLKEIVGDKFFIKHFLSQPEEIKTSEAPVAAAAAVVSAPVVSIKEEPKEEDEEDNSDIEDEADASKSVDVTPAVLALIQSNPDKPILFCCNLCPYKAAISSRLQRHYDKHFTKDKYQCRFCSWSSRNQQVLFNHEKLHTSPEEVVPSGIEVPFQEVSSRSSSKGPDDSNSGDNTTTTSSSDDPGSPSESTKSSEDVTHHPVQESIRKWCHAEKQRRPELEDAFTRKMIDGMKGFQCAECPYTSKYRGDMRSHKKRHDIDQMYRCVQCTYTTNRPVSLKDHLKQHANLNKALDPVTLRKVIVNQGIQIGMRRGGARGASGRVYTCAKCPYSTLTIGCLWRHYRNHRQTARMNICSNCSYSSMDQRKMEEHTIIHLAMGVNEPMPFVKRVDMNGRPVSSLTDLLGGSERKNNKRKMEEEPSTSGGTPDRPEFERFSKKKATPLAPKPAKIAKEEPSPVRAEPPATRGAGARRGSKEESPDSDYSLPGPSHAAPPTRVLSERATRNRTNYSALTKSSTRGTPSGSSAHLDQMVKREPDESIEVSHHRIRTGVHSNYGRDVYTKCKECPFKSTDEKLLEQHGTFHEGSPRPQQCTDCSFSHYTAAGLLEHLKLHGIDFDSFQKRLFHKMNRKGDVIPPGVKGYYCKNCSYKTPIKRHYEDHLMSHRQQLVNRLSISMKRQPPKPEYKRPKHRHLFVARNAKYCKKCTFKCSSHSAFIEHLDRHGWNQLYKCYICDYSDNNKSVVDFHQLTHHIVRDQTLHGITQASDFRLEQGEILKPETASKPKPTPEQFVQQSRSLLKCGSCDYFCHLSEELSFHMSVNHMDEPDTQQTISYLHMGLIPPNATITTVL